MAGAEIGIGYDWCAVVDTGATRGLLGYETYVAYKKSVQASALGQEFRESDKGAKFRVSNGQGDPAAAEASVPLTLTDMNGKVTPARNTRCVIHKQGGGVVPPPLSRPQMATVVLNNTAYSLRTAAGGGHMTISTMPNAAATGQAQGGSSDAVQLAPQASARPSAQPRHRVRCLQEVAFATDGAVARHMVQGAECSHLETGAELWAAAQSGGEGWTYLADYPESFAVDGPDADFSYLTRAQVDRFHRRMWRADFLTIRTWLPPAAGQDPESQKKARSLARSPGLTHGIVFLDSMGLEPPDSTAKYPTLRLVDVATKLPRVFITPAKGRALLVPSSMFSDQGAECGN